MRHRLAMLAAAVTGVCLIALIALFAWLRAT